MSCRRSKDILFRVHLRDFACEGLVPNKDTCEACLHIEFDSNVWRTDTEPNNTNPAWGFKTAGGFSYSITSLDQLSSRFMKVHCINKANPTEKSNNAPFGKATVDLHSLACGPTNVQLTLQSGDEHQEPRGTLKFICVMKMVSANLTVTCQEMTLKMQGCSAPASLEIVASLFNQKPVGNLGNQKPVKAEHSTLGNWPGPFNFVFNTTLHDLLKCPSPEYLQFIVMDEFGCKQGEAVLEFRKWFTMKPETQVQIKIPVTYTGTVDGENEPESFGNVGVIEGVVTYRNLPNIAQMVTGTFVDGEVECGQCLVEGLPYPKCFSEPPPVWQDPAERLGLENFSIEQMQNDEFELKPDDFDDKQVAELLMQIDLPPPWEKRRERVGGRMYFFDPRSRRMTWKDPRFLPENWDQKIDPQTGKVYFEYHKSRQTTFVDPRCCPYGWDMRISKNGEIYFAHLPPMKTTFQDPRGLPESIEPALDDLGRMYFKNTDIRSTAWEDPRLGQQEVVLAKWRHFQSITWLKEQILKEIEQRQEVDDPEEEEKDIS